MWGCMWLTDHSSLGDPEDIFVIHLINIKSEVSTLTIVVVFFHGCVPGVVVPLYAIGFIYIPRKLVLCFFITVQFCELRK